MKNNILTRRPVVAVCALFCCFLWGSAFPCIKIGCRLFGVPSSDAASQIVFAGERFVLAGFMALAAGGLLRKRLPLPSAKELPGICVLSLFQTVLQYAFFYVGLCRTTGVNGSIVTSSNVFLAILVSSLVFRSERLTLRKIAGCALGFSGVLVAALAGGANGGGFRLAGEGLVFLSALSYAFSASVSKRLSRRSDPAILSGWQFVLGGAFLTLAGLAAGGSAGRLTPAGGAMLLYLAFISAAAFSVWTALLKYNPVSSVSVFGFTNPVIGAALSALLLSEKTAAGPLRIISALALISAGIVAVNLSPPDKEDENG